MIRSKIESALRKRGSGASIGGYYFSPRSSLNRTKADDVEAGLLGLRSGLLALADEVERLNRDIQGIKRAA